MIESHSQLRTNLKNTIARLLHSCKNIRQLNQIHSHVITSPNLDSTDRSFLISRLLLNLCTIPESLTSLKYASKIFSFIPNPSLFTYNAMIRAKATKTKDPTSHECLFLYREVLKGGLVPDCITLPFVLKECSRRGDVFTGRSIHSHAVRFGCGGDIYVDNALISLYSECGVVGDARKVFDGMCERDVVSWNSVIVGCLRCGEIDVRSGCLGGMEVRKNIITWNSVITGLVQVGRPKEALEIFHEMQIGGDGGDGICPDEATVASALAACASLGAIDHGRWMHRYLERNGLECDVVIGTVLVDMYGKCGCIEKVFGVFKKMSEKDVLAWTVMF